jgi:ABC-type branched-subunit amino acid transport system substrate-binding protein
MQVAIPEGGRDRRWWLVSGDQRAHQQLVRSTRRAVDIQDASHYLARRAVGHLEQLATDQIEAGVDLALYFTARADGNPLAQLVVARGVNRFMTNSDAVIADTVR